MSDDNSVDTPLPSLTEAHLSARRSRALTISPDSHLFAESNNSYGASGTPSSSTTTVRESTASSYTMVYPSSRTSSAEPKESATSPIESPSSPFALSPSSLGSPIRVPARLRRMYAQFEGEQRDYSNTSVAASPTEKGKVVVVGVAKIEEEDSPLPAAGASPDRKPSPEGPEQRKTQRTGPRKRVPLPAPVPHLIKKSRGRRVPEPDEARERAHICAVPGCSKSFARAEHLKRHVISLHTYEKRAYTSTYSLGTYVSPFPAFFFFTGRRTDMGRRVVFLFCFIFLQLSYVNVARRLRAVITLCNTSACTQLDNTQDGADRWAVCAGQEPKMGAPSTTVYVGPGLTPFSMAQLPS
jgi:hypothetical protein